MPGYEQHFIDNLVKRGMGSAAGSSSNRKHANSLNSASTSKQFRKFIDASVNKSNSPLFTIFRMNPTTVSASTTSSPSNKRKKTSHDKKMDVKQHEELDLQYDSDCDSGVDLGCETLPKKTQRPVSMYVQAPSKSASLAPPSVPLHQTQSYNPLVIENSMFIPDELFITQQPNVVMSTTSDDSVSYFDNISTPSSIIMDQQLFSNDPSLDNWSQSAQSTSMFDLQPQSQLLGAQSTPYYDPSVASFASFSTDSNQNDYLLQQSHQSFQDYYLYNDFC